MFPPVLLVCMCGATGLQPQRFCLCWQGCLFPPWGGGGGTGGISRSLCWSGYRCRYISVCVSVHVCVHACVHVARPLCGVCSGSGLLQSHIPPAPLCSVLQKIFAFSTTHNFSSSIATRCESCGPRPHGNRGSSSRGSLLWRLPWELALLQGHGGGVGVGPGWGSAAPSPGCYLDRRGCFLGWVPQATAAGLQGAGGRVAAGSARGAPALWGADTEGLLRFRVSDAQRLWGRGRRGPGEACWT